MADSSPEAASDNTDVEFSSPEEQTAQIVNQKIMSQIHRLVEQDKYTALLQVVELSIQHVNQRKEIVNLQRCVKKALEERVQIKSDLIVQHNFKTNLQSIEDVKQNTSKRLREKLEIINAQIKTNETLRSHLKEDYSLGRLELEGIKVLLAELTEQGNFLQRTIEKGEARLKELNKQMNSISAEKAKLQHDCHAKECEMQSVSAKHAEITQHLKNELLACESSVKQRAEELKREQQNLVEQTNVSEQLKSELSIAQNDYEQLKQSMECELLKSTEHFSKQIAFTEKSLKDFQLEKENLLNSMMNSVAVLMEQNKATEERINELSSKQSELTNDLQSLNDRNSKLKQELDNHKKQQEIARMKESVKTRKVTAVAAAANKPSVPWNIRPKRQVFTKSSKNNHEPTAMNPSVCLISDSDQSCAFDTSAYFEGKL